MKVFKLLIIVLFLLYNMSVFAASVEMSAGKSKAVSIFGQVDVSDNYTESLLGLFLPDEARILPLGIKRTIGNVEYSIAISKIKFGKEYSELTAWGRVKIPDSQGDRFLFFGADRIKLSNEGDIIGEAKLALLEDVDIPLNGMTTISLSGSYDVSSGRASSKTYMAIDCDGFKELGIDADITFSNQVIRKVDEKGKVNPADSTVKVSFYTVIEDWNNILLSIDLPDFEVVGLPDFMFKIKSAVLDFSDRRNAHEMDFPVGYEGYLIPGNRDLWRGVYIKYLEVFLPEQFALKEGGGRVSFSACNMLWDNNGISGVFSAKNVLPLESGDAGGWAFSVEDFSMNLLASNINGIGFSGRLSIPVGEFSSLEYEAMISPANEYLLRVSNAEEMNFDIWSAKAIILPSSYVELKVVDGRFKPEAILNGRLEVNPIAGGTAKVSMDSIHFRRLHFRTEAPYLSVDYLGYSGKVGIQGFPVCIENIALLTQSDEAQLGFDITLNLGEQPFSLTATGGLSIVGGMDKEKGLRSWKYKRLEVSKIVVDASQAGTFDLKGSLEIRNDDPVYGDGFEANIDMTINVLQGLNLKTKAIFGKLDYRYWLVDGAVSFGGSGIPVFSGLYINGFGGGASYHMIRNGTGRDALPTGSVYIPDAGVGLGLKAAVMLNFGNPEAVKGEASFEIVFTRKGGLAFIGFFGQVEALSNSMLTDIKANVSGNLHKYQQREQDYTLANGGTEELHKMKAENPTEAAKRSVADKDIGKQGIQGALGIQYNFLEKSFHATFEVHINMLGGMLRGLGKNNSAGLSVLHIDPREWYMNMGTPDNMLGVKMDLAGLVKMETGSYFMMGTQIPDSPPPPVEVANVLGMDIKLLDYMRNLNELGKGKGFAFGSHLKVSTGNLHFMMLYAQLEVGVGFDIMLKQYKEAYCQGRSRELGMNGWYANGQAYAYMQGEIGVHVNLLFIKKKIPILEAGAAMLMQAKLPNPAWFAGYLGLKFNVLNGLVKGNVRMKIELGEECILVQPGASPLDMEVIGDISPSEESQDVDVFVNPQVAFNIPVGKKIVLYDEENRRSTYRFMLNEFSVWHGDKKLEGKWEWNASGDMVSCELHDLLPSKDKVKVLVSVGFEELKNGQWEALYVGGEKSEEKKEIVFTTGEAPDHIPLKNIVYCSPVIEQNFFFQSEADRGYVQLDKGQSYLFSDVFNYEIQLTTEDGALLRVPFGYDRGAKRIEYKIPDLQKGKRYRIDFLASSAKQSDPEKVLYEETELGIGADSVTLRQTVLSGRMLSGSASLLEYEFGTSRYVTLEEKLRMSQKRYCTMYLLNNYTYLGYNVENGEPFDFVDLQGNRYTGNKPLVTVEALLDRNDYYNKLIYPLIYKNYPYPEGIRLGNRNPKDLGVPPVRAITYSHHYLTQIESKNLTGMSIGTLPFHYDLMRVYADDYFDLRAKLTNYALNTGKLTEYAYVINSFFPAMTYGYYEIVVRYHKPDGTAGTWRNLEYDYGLFFNP